jgi:hypothetical protein
MENLDYLNTCVGRFLHETFRANESLPPCIAYTRIGSGDEYSLHSCLNGPRRILSDVTVPRLLLIEGKYCCIFSNLTTNFSLLLRTVPECIIVASEAEGRGQLGMSSCHMPDSNTAVMVTSSHCRILSEDEESIAMTKKGKYWSNLCHERIWELATNW